MLKKHKVQLTYSHCGLGHLNEVSLMTLFAEAFIRSLSEESGEVVTDFRDSEGIGIYPAYYQTHLKVEPFHPIKNLRLWQEIEFETRISRFGSVILSTEQTLTHQPHIKMNAGVSFVRDLPDSSDSEMTAPSNGITKKLNVLVKPPASLNEFKVFSNDGVDFWGDDYTYRSHGGFSYVIDQFASSTDDERPYIGHSMIFSQFFRYMNDAEWRFIHNDLKPSFIKASIDYINLMERTTYFLGTPSFQEDIQVNIKLRMTPAEEYALTPNATLVPLVILHFITEVTGGSNKRVLCVSSADKALLVPNHKPSMLNEMKRIVRNHINTRARVRNVDK